MTILSLAKARNALNNDHLVDFLDVKRETKECEQETKKLKQNESPVRMTEKEFTARQRDMHKTNVKQTTDFKLTGLVFNSQKYHVSVLIDGTITGENLLKDFTGKKNMVDPSQEYPVQILNCSVTMKKDGSASMKKDGSSVGFSQAQLYIATQVLGVLFGILIDKNKKRIPVFFTDKEFEQNIVQAVQWAHRVEECGDSMVYDPPSCLELYPNMRHVTLDKELQREKSELAKKNSELTCMAGVSAAKRNAMKQNHGVDRMDDPKLTVECLIPESEKAKRITVGALIDAIKREKDITPLTNIKEYREGDAGLDFETLKPGYEGWEISFLFMIGFAYKNDDCFEGIRVTKITKEEQLRILNYFLERVEELKIQRLIHWGNHEFMIFEKLEKYYDMSILNRFEMIDLNDITKSIPWAPKGAFDYSVKSFGKALYESNLIDTTWTTACTDGSSAAYEAGVAYLQEDFEELDDIQEYNRIDVIVMMQIYNYMRSIDILTF